MGFCGVETSGMKGGLFADEGLQRVREVSWQHPHFLSLSVLCPGHA